MAGCGGVVGWTGADGPDAAAANGPGPAETGSPTERDSGDATRVDADVADEARPEVAFAHDAALDSARHEVGASDVGAPDLGVSDLGVSDLGVSDLGVSDLGVSDVGGDATPVESGGPTNWLRVGNLSLGAAPIDFCIAAGTGAEFKGIQPFIYAATGGAQSGIAYGQMTAYFPAIAELTQYTVRAIAGGTTAATADTACQKELAKGATTTTNVNTGPEGNWSFFTYGAPSDTAHFGVATLQDLTGSPATAEVMARVFNALPWVASIDTEYLSGASWYRGTTGTPYGTSNLASVNTSLGLSMTPGTEPYVQNIPTIGLLEIGVFASGGADAGPPVTTATIDYSNRGTHSLYMFPATSKSAQILDCVDSQPIWGPTGGYLSPCNVLPAP
ncbi:MAG: hypothetical protein ACHREM_18630 [Polyangiales bacterium]